MMLHSHLRNRHRYRDHDRYRDQPATADSINTRLPPDFDCDCNGKSETVSMNGFGLPPDPIRGDSDT